jgi:hypothetical protein
VPGGVSGDPARRDSVVFDITPQGGGDASPGPGQMPGVSAGEFGHPSCHDYNVDGNTTARGVAADLPANK